MKKILLSLMAMLFICGITSCSEPTVSGNVSGHDYVDLGLPSGTLWATCNVGASKPTEYGDLFAWGETSTKKNYSWENYKWGSEKKLTKYNAEETYGIVDDKWQLDPEDDAAAANWKGEWRMPTASELQELIDGCDWEWTDDMNGSCIAGRIGVSKKNGKVIFLPVAGYSYYNYRLDEGDYGYYWSSSLYSDYPYGAYSLDYDSGYIYVSNSSRRYYGFSVRAVCPSKK